MNKARLFCKTGAFAGKEFEISSEALIGRSQTNTITLSAEAISNHHARIFYDADSERFVLEDLGSHNGTRLDGMRVCTPEPLNSLNVITFADAHDFIFQSEISSLVRKIDTAPAIPKSGAAEMTMMEDVPLSPPPVPNVPTADATVIDDEALTPLPVTPTPPDNKTIMEADIGLPPAPVDIPSLTDVTRVSSENSSPETYSLRVTKTGASFPLTEGDQTLGRKAPCEIVIADSSVSRKHARIHVSKGIVTITDLGSKNGVTINGSKIHSPVIITSEDSIRIGEVDVELIQ